MIGRVCQGEEVDGLISALGCDCGMVHAGRLGLDVWICAARDAHAGGKEAPQRVECFFLGLGLQLRTAAARRVVVFVVLKDFDARVDVEVLPCDGLDLVVGRWSATDEPLIGEDQRVSRVLFWEHLVAGIPNPPRKIK